MSVFVKEGGLPKGRGPVKKAAAPPLGIGVDPGGEGTAAAAEAFSSGLPRSTDSVAVDPNDLRGGQLNSRRGW